MTYFSISYSHVSLSSSALARAGTGVTRPLHACPLCVESCGEATVVVEAGPLQRARLGGAMSSAFGGAARAPVARGGQRDRPAAGAAGSRPGYGKLFRRHPP